MRPSRTAGARSNHVLDWPRQTMDSADLLQYRSTIS